MQWALPTVLRLERPSEHSSDLTLANPSEPLLVPASAYWLVHPLVPVSAFSLALALDAVMALVWVDASALLSDFQSGPALDSVSAHQLGVALVPVSEPVTVLLFNRSLL